MGHFFPPISIQHAKNQPTCWSFSNMSTRFRPHMFGHQALKWKSSRCLFEPSGLGCFFVTATPYCQKFPEPKDTKSLTGPTPCAFINQGRFKLQPCHVGLTLFLLDSARTSGHTILEKLKKTVKKPSHFFGPNLSPAINDEHVT